ncbi:hypothetical protein D3C76_1339370 [compost metagenome]
MALYCRTQATASRLAVLEHVHFNAGQVQVTWIDTRLTQGENPAGGVVGHGVLDADLPVVDT